MTAAAGRPLPGGAQALQVGDQVGEVARAEPGGQPVGHQRCVAGRALLDLRLANDLPVPVGVDERQLLRRLSLDDPREDPPVGGGDDRRPIAFDDLARGVEHRLDQAGRARTCPPRRRDPARCRPLRREPDGSGRSPRPWGRRTACDRGPGHPDARARNGRRPCGRSSGCRGLSGSGLSRQAQHAGPPPRRRWPACRGP